MPVQKASWWELFKWISVLRTPVAELKGAMLTKNSRRRSKKQRHRCKKPRHRSKKLRQGSKKVRKRGNEVG
jgi:hypothetical protein